MALGEAAGVAAAQSIKEGKKVQELCIDRIQDRLLKNKASLVYFKDIAPGHPDFNMVEKMALKGYITGWEAELDKKHQNKKSTVFKHFPVSNCPVVLKPEERYYNTYLTSYD